MPISIRSQSQIDSLEKFEGESACVFISTKGLMRLCESPWPHPRGAQTKWPLRQLRTHKPGGRIYVHATALVDFVRRALPRISGAFVLVTGDSIVDVGPDTLGQETIDALLTNPHLQEWFVQNTCVDHPKITALPLGLDLHTLQENRRQRWGPGASARAQEDLLHTLRALGPKLTDRAPLGYSNWHLGELVGVRADVFDALPRTSCCLEDIARPRAESWRRNMDCFFTFSPRGSGMDCHRTWEALLLGSVPIVSETPISAVYEGLPVVTVRNWAELTPDALQSEKERILNEQFDFAPLLLQTWRRRFHGRTDLPDMTMRYQDFMDLDERALRDRIA